MLKGYVWHQLSQQRSGNLMATTINNARPNTFTQQQWDNQPSSTSNLTQTSKQFQDQFSKTGASLAKLAEDSGKLGQTANDAAAYVDNLKQFQKDFDQFHQDQIQLSNTAKTEGSPYALGLANSLGDEGRQIKDSTASPTAALSSEQKAVAVDVTNKVLRSENDIQQAGSYTINGNDFNNATYTNNGSSQYIDPNDFKSK